MLLVALVVPVLLSGCRSKKEVINRESEVRVDSSLNSSSGKSLVKNKVASEKDSEVVGSISSRCCLYFLWIRLD